MIVHTVNRIADLAPYQQRWDELAGDCPFRSWSWLTTWWKHYGHDHELLVLLVGDEPTQCRSKTGCQGNLPAPGKVTAILPVYVEVSRTRGRVLRLLGDGEVCSEHLDLLCDKGRAAEVVKQLARFLIGGADNWDAIQLTTMAENDRNLGLFVEELAANGCSLECRVGLNLWSIPLPATWEEFLAMQSKSHRKQLRQLKSRVLETGKARWVEVDDQAAFDRAWEVLIDLHQRRRQSLGEPGCFASPPWANFHREVALELLAVGRLRLSILELDNHPVAAEYHVAGCEATYAYQGGIDPDRVADEPGQLSLILCLERAIASGQQRFELLRGDEPYKPHWRAEPTATSDIEIISPRAWARWRYYSLSKIHRAGRLARQFANLLS
jgi:CelD/BcsL family acetyltransferase involved in cellulose biosynthesis